jgi:hypothetical protein
VDHRTKTPNPVLFVLNTVVIESLTFITLTTECKVMLSERKCNGTAQQINGLKNMDALEVL